MTKNICMEAGLPYTGIPNYFLDHIAPSLSASELRVMLYVLRHTLGYQKFSDTICYDQFLNGITTRDGRKLDNGTGISRCSLVAALANLEKKKLISRTSNNGGYAPSTITLILEDLTTKSEFSANSNSSENLSDNSNGVQTRENNQLLEVSTNVKEEVEKTDLCEANLQLTQVEKTDHTKQIFSNQNKYDQDFGGKENIIGKIKMRVNQSDTNRKGGEEGISFTQLKSEQVDEKDTETFSLAVDFICSNISGISRKTAKDLVQTAFANGRDFSYIELMVHHVLRTAEIRVPAAVLVTLIRANETRSPIRVRRANSLSAHGANNRLGATSKFGSMTFSKTSVTHLPFSLSSSNEETSDSDDLPPALDLETPVLDADTVLRNYPVIDFRLRYLLQEFDPQAVTYLRELRVNENCLVVKFIGLRKPDLTNWLPQARMLYPELERIEVVN
jgi:hypothetical protein